jgi:hypothetical protein
VPRSYAQGTAVTAVSSSTNVKLPLRLVGISEPNLFELMRNNSKDFDPVLRFEEVDDTTGDSQVHSVSLGKGLLTQEEKIMRRAFIN